MGWSLASQLVDDSTRLHYCISDDAEPYIETLLRCRSHLLRENAQAGGSNSRFLIHVDSEIEIVRDTEDSSIGSRETGIPSGKGSVYG